MITVYRINIPAMSTIGHGYGKDEEGKDIRFVGDHRPMRDIGEAIAAAKSEDDLPQVEPEGYQVIEVKLPRYYECGICGHNHPWDWDGDCRDDVNRFTDQDLDDKHGPEGYELLGMEDRVAADQRGEY